MALKNLNKGRFVAFLDCPLTAWRLRHGEIDSIDPEDEGSLFRARQGHIIGNLATMWFDALLVTSGKLLPNGRAASVNIDTELEARNITRENNANLWLQQGILLTQQAMQNPNVVAIYEATFSCGSYVTRADILARSGRGYWNMIEVKSIQQKKEYKYISDMAYTTRVLQCCGVLVDKIGLMRIDKDYILQSEPWLQQPSQLLNLLEINWTLQEEVLMEIRKFDLANQWAIVDAITSSDQKPPAKWHPSCKKCESCREVYQSTDRCHLLLDVPHINDMGEAFTRLATNKISCLEDVPAGFFGSKNSYTRTAAVIAESVKQNKMFVSTTLKQDLGTYFSGSESSFVQEGPIVWPVLYLDFEFLMTAIPLYESDHPYQKLPFEYSIHRAEAGPPQKGLFAPNLDTLQHREYLMDPKNDQRYQLAERLVRDIQEMGSPNSSIVVYNSSAESGCISELAEYVSIRNQDLADALNALNHRLVDFLKIMRKPSIYHPDFHGSFSLKKVIQVFMPKLYADLGIASGEAALARYGELAYAHRLAEELSPWYVDPQEQKETMEHLRQYCKLDTHSLVMLHAKLVELAVNSGKYLNESHIQELREVSMVCQECGTLLQPKDRRNHGLRCRKKATG